MWVTDNSVQTSGAMRECVNEDSSRREQALEESFWDGVFGIVGIRNHSEIDFTDPDIFRLHRESSQEALKVR